MALPAILRAAAAVKTGSDRLVVASRLNKIASNPVVQGLARATGANKIPALNSAGSYLSKIKDVTKAKAEEKDKVAKSSGEKTRQKAKDTAEKTREHNEKANKAATQGTDEEVSLLKVIAKDTVRVRDAVEELVKNKEQPKQEGKGLLGSLMGALGGLLPSLLGGAGKGAGFLGKLVARGAGALAATKIGSKVIGGARGLLSKAGIGAAPAAARAAPDVKSFVNSAGRTVYQDPKTGKFLSAAEAGRRYQSAAAAAPKGIIGRGVEAAKGLGAKASGIASKAGGLLGRGAAKTVGKSLLKKIPIIGGIAGLGFAANRAMAGDWTGAGLEAASGLASTIPGIGTAASVGIDAGLAARDYARENAAASPTPAPKTPAPVKAAAAPVSAAAARTVVASPTMQATLSKMLDLMNDETKGIYVRSALTPEQIQQRASTLSQPKTAPVHSPKGYSAGGPVDTSYGSKIGPVTMGKDGPVSGESMHAGPIAGHDGLGSLSAHYESGKRGSSAVGWDSTGGTSYGKYQIAAKTGTMAEFMKYLQKNNPKAYAALAAAGPADAGKNGQFAQVWKQLAKDGTLGTSEHDFIKKSHYDPGMKAVKSESLRAMIGKSKALQDVMWSTTVQHGGKTGGNIFNKVYREGMSEQDLIRAIYAERGTRFGSSKPQVRASVQNRFRDEAQRALAAVGQSPTGMVRDTAVARAQSRQAPVVVQAPAKRAPAGQGKAATQRTAASNTPMIVRNPDSPVRSNILALIRTT